MADQLQKDALIWRDGDVPVAVRFDDPYFSLDDGLAEARHTFLAGNDLPQRFRPGFHIAELGFGTGLNLMASWAAWQEAGVGGRLKVTSFEAFPMTTAQMSRALTRFAGLDRLARTFLAVFDGQRAVLDDLEFNLVVGDARHTLPQWDGRADAWFLDGFSPAKNPELWEAGLMAEVGRHTAAGGTFATYTAAGHVRRALDAAGFSVERVPGFGRKRHMSRGRLR